MPPKKAQTGDEIDTLKIAELKERLKALNLNIKGSKPELVERLKAAKPSSPKAAPAAVDIPPPAVPKAKGKPKGKPKAKAVDVTPEEEKKIEPPPAEVVVPKAKAKGKGKAKAAPILVVPDDVPAPAEPQLKAKAKGKGKAKAAAPVNEPPKELEPPKEETPKPEPPKAKGKGKGKAKAKPSPPPAEVAPVAAPKPFRKPQMTTDEEVGDALLNLVQLASTLPTNNPEAAKEDISAIEKLLRPHVGDLLNCVFTQLYDKAKELPLKPVPPVGKPAPPSKPVPPSKPAPPPEEKTAKWDDKVGGFVDEDGFLYDGATESVFGRVKNGKVTTLTEADVIRLGSQNIAVWHTDIKGRKPSESASDKEIDELLKENAKKSTQERGIVAPPPVSAGATEGPAEWGDDGKVIVESSTKKGGDLVDQVEEEVEAITQPVTVSEADFIKFVKAQSKSATKADYKKISAEAGLPEMVGAAIMMQFSALQNKYPEALIEATQKTVQAKPVDLGAPTGKPAPVKRMLKKAAAK
jgi:hypothetical protein